MYIHTFLFFMFTINENTISIQNRDKNNVHVIFNIGTYSLFLKQMFFNAFYNEQ